MLEKKATKKRIYHPTHKLTQSQPYNPYSVSHSVLEIFSITPNVFKGKIPKCKHLNIGKQVRSSEKYFTESLYISNLMTFYSLMP